MRCIAVTGTNGKTTTTTFCRQLLTRDDHRAASFGSLGLVRPSGRQADPSVAVGPRALSDFLTRLTAEGMDTVALEAHSRALSGVTYDHVDVDVAVFTNLARDHLDVHDDMATYFEAKRSLFTESLVDDGTAVINVDDDRAPQLLDCCRDRGVDVMTYGRDADADVSIRGTAPSSRGVTVDLSVDGQQCSVALDVVGDVMVENACAAVAAVRATGREVTEILDDLGDLQPPPGRLERVGMHRGVELFVDYAHTPAALRAVLESFEARSTGDLVVVFGCGGNRDRGKRREMGAVAAECADRAVVTDDNPRSEDPATIRQAILTGCPDARECGSRKRAIELAVSAATAGDIIVVAGKGHERQQVCGTETVAFSDHDVLREVMESRPDRVGE
ncbi:Mur ligase family protein [Halovivax cerinus]|uniref:Mur ligase family protein n=1 Tax=Halovivax cerinus TaxID=1487865 RepID=A0ABD5NM17_9EURY|nr:UDP-N-acetylmuramyl-tripeptide synthetase [Halovivax cerinus]